MAAGRILTLMFRLPSIPLGGIGVSASQSSFDRIVGSGFSASAASFRSSRPQASLLGRAVRVFWRPEFALPRHIQPGLRRTPMLGKTVMQISGASLLLSALVFASSGAYAHHSFAMFDAEK